MLLWCWPMKSKSPNPAGGPDCSALSVPQGLSRLETGPTQLWLNLHLRSAFGASPLPELEGPLGENPYPNPETPEVALLFWEGGPPH